MITALAAYCDELRWTNDALTELGLYNPAFASKTLKRKVIKNMKIKGKQIKKENGNKNEKEKSREENEMENKSQGKALMQDRRSRKKERKMTVKKTTQ